VRLKSVILGFATAGAMVLSTVAVTLPASAAPVTSSRVSASAASTVIPYSYGTRLCTTNGVFCVQRVTSIDNGSAYVEAWADTITWTGWFQLYGPDGPRGRPTANKTWERGGAGYLWDIPKGGGWYIIAYQNPASPVEIGRIDFAV
jgi:hypothetical protein